MDSQSYDEEAARERRRQRMREAKRQKQRQMMFRRLVRRIILPIAAVFLLVLLLLAGKRFFNKPESETEIQITKTEELSTDDIIGKDSYTPEASIGTDMINMPDIEEESSQESINRQENDSTSALNQKGYTFRRGTWTQQLGGEIVSNYAVIIELDSGKVLAEKNAESRINPASMTKILTVLVAAENIENLEDTFTVTRDITDYSYTNDCSNAGFAENETVSIRDLFYGTILPSGADAAASLAIYTAGSLEAFEDMMNEKLKELGISETAHFTNCAGIYEENHYCTVMDMAVILKAALENEFCREVLSAHTYTTTATDEHPEGITISNWFLRRIEDKDTGGEVVCGKTGYVVESGNCAASYGVDAKGKGYICVTADATSGWRCIYDHVALYKQFLD